MQRLAQRQNCRLIRTRKASYNASPSVDCVRVSSEKKCNDVLQRDMCFSQGLRAGKAESYRDTGTEGGKVEACSQSVVDAKHS